MEGRCQCSQISFTTSTPQPLKIYFCHCTECRHQSSSAFGISAIFPYFEIPDPHAKVGIYSRATVSGKTLECLFCKTCGSRLMHRSPLSPLQETTATVSVKGGCLEGLSKEMLKRAAHIWCKEAVVEIPAEAERWEEEPLE